MASRIPWKHKKPGWSYTGKWDAKCPACDEEFDQDDVECPRDRSDLVVRTGEVPKRRRELKNFFLTAFRFSRMVGRQEICCSANDGHSAQGVVCPNDDCRTFVVGDYLRGIYLAPRLILYVPFVLVLSLGVVRATGGVAFIFWPFVSRFFGRIYRRLFCHSWWPRPLIYLFNKEMAVSFYETNDAPDIEASGRGQHS